MNYKLKYIQITNCICLNTCMMYGNIDYLYLLDIVNRIMF